MALTADNMIDQALANREKTAEGFDWKAPEGPATIKGTAFIDAAGDCKGDGTKIKERAKAFSETFGIPENLAVHRIALASRRTGIKTPFVNKILTSL